jgi:hypothetical protein
MPFFRTLEPRTFPGHRRCAKSCTVVQKLAQVDVEVICRFHGLQVLYHSLKFELGIRLIERLITAVEPEFDDEWIDPV